MSHLVISNRRIDNATYFESPEDLEVELTISEYTILLFSFWSWKVPSSILSKYKCYGMHTGFMLDGKGLGGSPIDNLKNLGVEFAALNVFEMNEIIDGGRVRLAIPIDLRQDKQWIVGWIDGYIPRIVEFIKQDISAVPVRFKRLPNVK